MNYLTPNTLYLCIDQGGHASRAIIYNHNGEMLASAYTEIETQHPENYFVEHNANEVIDSINSAIQQVLKKIGDKKKYIVSAGLATQRSNVVCWNKKTGEALSPIISWQDRRNTHWLEQFNEQNEFVHKTTGLFLSPHYGASKLRWCIDHIDEVKNALTAGSLAFGPMSSFITHHLVREKNSLVDPANASRTQLWNLKKHDWDNELLNLFDIPRSALPKCVPSIYDYGTLNIAETNIPLQLVTGDQSAAMYAYGQLQVDTAYVNTGTGAFLSRPSGPLQLYGRRLLTSIIFQDKKENRFDYVLEGTINGAGSALEWLSQQFPDTDIFKHLPDWLSEIKSPPLFFNGISGLASPFWLPNFISKFDREAGVNEKAVAIIESIVFLLKACLDEMRKLSSPPEQIQITGGIAMLDGLNQRLADLTKLPVYCPTQCEATSRGCAYLLAKQPTVWPEQEAGEWFKAKDNPGLQQRYLDWTEAMLKSMREK